MPYRTLNIQPSTAKDAFGRYMTYRITPVFALNNTTAGTVAPNVDASCRTTAGGNPWISAGANVNRAKARFCCPASDATGNPAANDIVVTDGAAVPQTLSPNTRLSLNLVNASTPNDGILFLAPGLVSAVAVILISHGKNGYGAFLANGAPAATGRLGRVGGAYTGVGTGGPGPNEANFNGSETVLTKVDAIANEAPAAYFDDIVTWKTQDQLFAFLGRQTCTAP